MSKSGSKLECWSFNIDRVLNASVISEDNLTRAFSKSIRICANIFLKAIVCEKTLKINVKGIFNVMRQFTSYELRVTSNELEIFQASCKLLFAS